MPKQKATHKWWTKYTFEDYRKWDSKRELYDGVPLPLAPSPKPLHQEIVGNIYTALKQKLTGSARLKVCFELDWKVSEETVVCPDVVVTDKPVLGDYIDFSPSIVFEVLSPSTEQRDCVMKYQIYEAQGVGYYCIVDADKRIVRIYSNGEGVFVKEFESGEGSFRFEGLECELRLEMEEIWR